MKLDLSEILSHVGMQYPYDIDEPPIVDEDLECGKRIQGKILFNNTGNVLLINGAAETEVVLPCSRCLEYYSEPVRMPVTEAFPLEPMATGPRVRQTMMVVEEDESPIAGRLFEGPLFDLTELLRQGITLALPSQPLHDENCKGLCPHCGQNLNEGACECRSDIPNPALAKLGELLGEKKTDE
jgi:uncharacterized protein